MQDKPRHTLQADLQDGRSMQGDRRQLGLLRCSLCQKQ